MKEQQELMGELLLRNARMPALSVSWRQQGTIHAVAAGSIDASEKPPRRVDTDTPFQAASLSKPVSAAIVLDLIEQGQWGLDLDTPLAEIADYGPPEIQQDTENYKKLTIGMVLGQHSGLPNWFWLSKKNEFIATPGEHFTYSGEAYEFLHEVIWKKTGRRWAEIAQEFFTKAGMTSSTYKQLPVVANRAVAIAHEIARVDGTLIPDRAKLPVDAHELLAGTLRTTAKDYIAFLQYCFKNLKSTLLTGSDVYPFNPKVHLNTSIAADQFQWSLGTGIYTDPTTNKAIAFHWGNNNGTRTFFAMDTKTGDCVACFSNSENGPAVFQEIAKPIVGDIQPLFQWFAAFDFKDAIAPQAPEAIAEMVYSMTQMPHVGTVNETTPSWRHSTQKSTPSPHDDEASESPDKKINTLQTKPQGK